MATPHTLSMATPGMARICLHGDLQRFGRRFDLCIKKGAEGIYALAMQIPGFRQKMSNGWYQIRIAGQDVDETSLSARLHEPLPDGAIIHIIPRMAGAKSGGLFQVILGAVANTTGVTPAALSAVLRNQGLLRPDLATAAELTDINAAVGKTFYYINGRALTNYSSSYGAHSIVSFSSATGANDGAVQLVVTGPPATPELSLRVKRGTSWYQQSLYTAALLGTKLYDLGTGGGGIASLSGVPEGGTGDMRTDWQQCVTKQYAQQVTVRTGWPVSSAVSADNGGVSFHVPGYNHNGRILITDSNKMFFQTGNSSAPLYRSWVQVAGQIDINNIVIGNLIYATTTAATLNYGDTVSGSTLKPAGVSSSGSVTNQVVPPILSGTYQCLGSVTVSGQASLFMRVL